MVKLTEIADQAAVKLDAVAKGAEKALDWGKRKGAAAEPHLPNAADVKDWLAKSATWGEKPQSNSLEHLERVLTETIAAILQTSDSKARIVVTAAVGKIAGAAAAGGVTGLIGLLGTAATGTAIGTLSGAAATSAKLYWIGAMVGGGVAAGGAMLAAGGIGVGLAAGMVGRNAIMGKPRDKDKLQYHEKALLTACITLINAIKQQRDNGQNASSAEMDVVAREVLMPLAHQIDLHWDERALEQNGNTECQAFTQVLAHQPLRKLDRCRIEIGRIAISAMETARNQ